MAFPKKDSLLADYSTNFNTKLVASATTYGLTSAQATSYTAVHTPFMTAWNALVAARAAGIRDSSLVATKETTKFNLLAFGRQLYAFVQNNATVLPANKIALGVVVRDTTPTPIPPPAIAPKLSVISVNAWTVRVLLQDASDLTRKAKPPGVSGASIYSFVGATAPTNLSDWKLEGLTGKTQENVAFDDTLTPGTKIWLTAQWFSPAKQTGPACDPISTNLQGGGVSSLAA